MIKFHSEKQEEMAKEVKEFVKEAHNYITTSQQEVLFVQESLRDFKRYCADFLRKLEQFRTKVGTRIQDTILDKEDKLPNEKKANYNSILTYTFKEFQKRFDDLLALFSTNFCTPFDEIDRRLSEFLTKHLAELAEENSKLGNEITLMEDSKRLFKLKKEEYVDFVNRFDLGELVRFKSQQRCDDKSELTRVRQAAATGRLVLQKVRQAQPKLRLAEPRFGVDSLLVRELCHSQTGSHVR